MIYIVELKIKVEGMKVTRRNQFKGTRKLQERIQKWIYELRKEYGYREMTVEKVIVNNEDITKKIAPTHKE
jgi:hypothetical protein